MDGILMFIRYALPPNILRLCGPESSDSLFEILTNQVETTEIRNQLLQFTGAVPYLRLIAQSNGIKDEFDMRVVNAYWCGSDLLKNVQAGDLFDNLETRFKKMMELKNWSWLIKKSVPDAKPFHSFHVFDVYRRAGLIRSGIKANVLETMDKCRIAWGIVRSIDKGNALVDYNPLEFRDKKLAFGERKTRSALLIDSSIRQGDEVSLHWDYVCDKITQEQKRNLIHWTKFHLDIANQTI